MARGVIAHDMKKDGILMDLFNHLKRMRFLFGIVRFLIGINIDIPDFTFVPAVCSPLVVHCPSPHLRYLICMFFVSISYAHLSHLFYAINLAYVLVILFRKLNYINLCGAWAISHIFG